MIEMIPEVSLSRIRAFIYETQLKMVLKQSSAIGSRLVQSFFLSIQKVGIMFIQQAESLIYILHFIPLLEKQQQMKLCSSESNDGFRDIRIKQFNLYSQQKLQFRQLHRNQQMPDYTLPQHYSLIVKGVPTEFRTHVWGSLLGHNSNSQLQEYQNVASEVDDQMEELTSEYNLQKQTKLKKGQSTSTQNSFQSISSQSNLGNAHNSLGQKSRRIIQTLNKIEVDLPRTFPDLPDLHNDPECSKKLVRLLSVFSCLRDDVGYIQGMTQIGALILLETNNQYQSFEALSTLLCRSPLRDFFMFDDPKIRNMCKRVEDRLQKIGSDVYHVLLANEIETKMYVIGWIMTMFTRCFEIDSILNIWDIIFANKVSPTILAEVCAAVVVSRKKKIMSQGNPSKMVKIMLHTKLDLVEEEWVLGYLRKAPRCVV